MVEETVQQALASKENQQKKAEFEKVATIADMKARFQELFSAAQFQKPESMPLMGPGKSTFFDFMQQAIKKHSIDESSLGKILSPVNQFLQQAELETDYQTSRLVAQLSVENNQTKTKDVLRLVLDAEGNMTARSERGVSLNLLQLYVAYAKATFDFWLKLYDEPAHFPQLNMINVKTDEELKIAKKAFDIYFQKLRITKDNSVENKVEVDADLSPKETAANSKENDETLTDASVTVADADADASCRISFG